MKSLLILSFYYTPDLCAGSFRTAALIDALKPLAKIQNCHIDLITTMPNRYHQFKVKTDSFEEKENFNIYRIPLPSHHSGFIDQAKAFACYFFQAKKIAKKKQYDIVFATSSRLFTAYLGARISKGGKTPLFLDMRDIFTDTMNALLPNYLKLFFLPIFKIVERYTLKRATMLNMVSPGFIDYFANKVNLNCKLLQISNGVDECFQNANIVTQTKDNQRTETVILYAGNIGSGQAIEKIIPPLAKLIRNTHATQYTKCVFRIIGSGGKLEMLKKACHNLPNVDIISPMSRTELIEEYRKADILFLHFDKYNAFQRVLPSKIFEYAMMKKPILAGVFGYSEQFLREHIPWSFVFTPCDTNDAFQKLNHLLNTNNQISVDDTYDFYQLFNRNSLMTRLSNEILLFTE